MAWGGKRSGAGRKTGVPNATTKDLRDKINASKLIAELHSIALDNKYEPTTNERINAIKFLLNKVLPDVQRQDITIQESRETRENSGDTHFN